MQINFAEKEKHILLFKNTEKKRIQKIKKKSLKWKIKKQARENIDKNTPEMVTDYTIKKNIKTKYVQNKHK